VKLTTVQIEILDVLSRKVNQYIDEKTAPMLAAMAAGTKQLFEHDPRMRKQLKGAGVTIKDYAEREIDMPLYEPHTGLRSFFGQALRPQIEEQLLLYDLVPVRAWRFRQAPTRPPARGGEAGRTEEPDPDDHLP